jgi:opacity protein-like surface antigen
MRRLLIAWMLIQFVGRAEGSSLEDRQSYRLEVTIEGIAEALGQTVRKAYKGSRFTVVSEDSKYYVVRFLITNEPKGVTDSVLTSELYLVPREYRGVDVTKIVSKTVSGPVSGPLVVPFKFRLNDRSLTGEATIGYYAGWAMSAGLRNSYRLPIVPFISGGLSQVNVESVTGESEAKSAITWAAGLLIQNWGDLSIGVLYGQDRVGDQSWKHEGDGWASFNVGWVLSH